MLLKKDFEGSSEQYWFKTTTERASSIQEVIARDSIVARRRPIADFFNSIGQTRSFADVRAMSALPPEAVVERTSMDGRFVPQPVVSRCSKVCECAAIR